MHGMHRTPTYRSWEHMIQRCTNPKNKKWPHYGGRGITVCESWRDFRNFYADMGERPKGLTIERVDVNGNYEPANCRWATTSEQNYNRRPAEECRNGHPWRPETTAYFFSAAKQTKFRRCLVCRAKREPRHVRLLSDGAA